MAKVSIRAGSKSRSTIQAIAHSDVIAAQLRPIAQAVLERAAQDPNERYASQLRIGIHHSRGRFGRVSWRVGNPTALGARVEAKRGTLARALGAAGV